MNRHRIARRLWPLLVVSAVMALASPAGAQDIEEVTPADVRLEHAIEIFETRSLTELRSVYEAGPGDHDYDIVVEEYGSDWDEWRSLWIAHNPDITPDYEEPAEGGVAALTWVLGAMAIAVAAGGAWVWLQARRERLALQPS